MLYIPPEDRAAGPNFCEEEVDATNPGNVVAARLAAAAVIPF